MPPPTSSISFWISFSISVDPNWPQWESYASSNSAHLLFLLIFQVSESAKEGENSSSLNTHKASKGR